MHFQIRPSKIKGRVTLALVADNNEVVLSGEVLNAKASAYSTIGAIQGAFADNAVLAINDKTKKTL